MVFSLSSLEGNQLAFDISLFEICGNILGFCLLILLVVVIIMWKVPIIALYLFNVPSVTFIP